MWVDESDVFREGEVDVRGELCRVVCVDDVKGKLGSRVVGLCSGRVDEDEIPVVDGEVLEGADVAEAVPRGVGEAPV